MIEQCCLLWFGFLHIHQKDYLNLVWNCDKLEQVNGGCSWVNQFEIRDKCIEFVINVNGLVNDYNWGFISVNWCYVSERPQPKLHKQSKN